MVSAQRPKYCEYHPNFQNIMIALPRVPSPDCDNENSINCLYSTQLTSIQPFDALVPSAYYLPKMQSFNASEATDSNPLRQDPRFVDLSQRIGL
jgi:hypothetical protein